MKLSFTRLGWTTIVVPFVAVAACGNDRELYIGEDCDSGFCNSQPAFTPEVDASSEAGSAVRSYCPSGRCPSGHTTCPTSEFICDIDLLTDVANCGECGNACPSSATDKYVCDEGRCVLVCDRMHGLDCDGIPDNGCEASPLGNDHCGACGRKCPADNPCVQRSSNDYQCGCPDGQTWCPNPNALAQCVDLETDDANCAACGNACPPEGDGRERPPNTHFGCYDHECGTLKCDMFYDDCDKVPETGCEALLVDDHNCGVCGNECAGGTHCRLDQYYVPQCMCAPGQTYCERFCIGEICVGTCADLTSDKDNCGACGFACPQPPLDVQACSYGKCELTCTMGRGDCNGNLADGCETNIASDPKNCGGCGHVCDAIAGQACVDGQCLVEPCDVLEDAGGTAR